MTGLLLYIRLFTIFILEAGIVDRGLIDDIVKHMREEGAFIKLNPETNSSTPADNQVTITLLLYKLYTDYNTDIQAVYRL